MEPANASDTSDDGPVQNAPMKTAIEPAGPNHVAFRQGLVENNNPEPPSRRPDFPAKLQALKYTLHVLFAQCKAPLRRSKPKERSILLGLPPEIREMIWKELVEGDYVTLIVKENRKYKNCLRDRGFWWQSREWVKRGEIKIKDRAESEIKIGRAHRGISISMLLACKQMHREIVDVYFRRAVVELNPVVPFCFEPLAPSYETLKPKATIGILANVRFVSTSLKLDYNAPWDFMAEEISWFFRLLRNCPRVRMIQIQANFSHHYDPYPALPARLCDQAREKMQMLASRAYELLPMRPKIIRGPRPVPLTNPTRDCTCGQDAASCRCTWAVTFAFRPEDDPFVHTDFHIPGQVDWSNQILFTRPWRRRTKGVTFNRLERQIINPTIVPKTILEIQDIRDLPKEYSLTDFRVPEMYTPKQTLLKRWRNEWKYNLMLGLRLTRPFSHAALISFFEEADG